MNIPFLLAAFIYFLPQIILLIILTKVLRAHIILYRKKKNVDYPILPEETKDYFFKDPVSFFGIYTDPFFILKIVFERHKDKELKHSAQRVKLIIFSYFLVMIFEFALLILHILS